VLTILVFTAASWYLVGLSWTVALVTYPGFGLVGKDDWRGVHAFHSRRIAFAVGPMWAVEGLSAGLWLVHPPSGTFALAAISTAATVATVAMTVWWAVPAHERLSQGFSPALGRRLRVAHLVRTGAWTAAAASATVALAQHLG